VGGAVIGFNAYAAAKLRAAIADYEADGETLDFRSLLPELVPDDQNFCAIPELANLADEELGKANRERIEAMALPEPNAIRGPRPSLPNGATTGKSTDLTLWAKWLTGNEPHNEASAAEAVERALSKDPELVEALIAAVDRPAAAWTPAWKTQELPEILYGIQVPHLKSAQDLIPVVSLLVQVAERTQDTEHAVELTLAQLRLAEAAYGDPMLVGTLVGTTCLTEAFDSIWTIFASGLQTPETIDKLRSAIGRIDVRAAMLQACRADLATGCQAIRYVKSRNELFKTMSDLSYPEGESNKELSFISRKLWSMFTPGICDLNSVNLIGLEYRHLIHPIRDSGIAAASEGSVLEEELTRRKGIWRLDSIFVKLALPMVMKAAKKIAVSEAYFDLAITACRLEAHFAEHGSYPETLGDLPPDMSYDRTASRYRLWLPGPDGEDDGGKRILDPEKPEKTKFHADDYQGDWVWDYPVES
tara:strand:+ start:91 stop:1512 length:1422 start_codon:yes stop_codon:yes gene_type:complete